MNSFTKLVSAAAIAAVTFGFAGAASASPVPPTASRALLGTWVNANPNTHSVKQIVVDPLKNGSVDVDAFGACGGGLCEWGQVPALVYAANVSAEVGTSFQTNQAFYSNNSEWSRTTLLANLVKTRSGVRLNVRELTVFEDGSGRKNFTELETFKHGKGQQPDLVGYPVSTYEHGNPPALDSSAFGTWKNVNSATRGIAKIQITGTGLNPVVRGFGACTPTYCDFGRSKGITYGDSISSSVGETVLAPYTFGFKNEQLVITYQAKSDQIAVGEWSEFTDGSGRSNYRLLETFDRV